MDVLGRKDEEVAEKQREINNLKEQYKIIQNLESQLNDKERVITDQTNVIHALEKQCKNKHELREDLKKKDEEMEEKKREIDDFRKQHNIIKELEEDLAKRSEEMITKNYTLADLQNKLKTNEQELEKRKFQYNNLLKQYKKKQREQERDMNRLQEYEEICPALQAELGELQQKLNDCERLNSENEAKLANAMRINKQLSNELGTTGKEKKELLHRLSKIAGAKLCLNNPNIADLSDDKRPTKLAEEFTELYDNEWTDAFEDIDIESEQDKTLYMLSLLERAYGLCKSASQNHMEKIKRSICELKLADEHTIDRSHREKLAQTDNRIPKTKCCHVVFDFEKFHDEQKKVVGDLRKFVEIKLSAEFEKTIVDNITNEYSIDRKKQVQLYNYIVKCVRICWCMCRAEIPVAIGLTDVHDGMRLDTSVFKPYTKTGKFVDFIVWPPLNLHENGPLLCKGVAQGKA